MEKSHGYDYDKQEEEEEDNQKVEELIVEELIRNQERR